MNIENLKIRPNKRFIAKSISLVLVVALATYGAVSGVNYLIGYTNNRLDAFATHRVEQRNLPISIATKEVPVLTQDQIDKLSTNVQATVKSQVDASIKSYLK